MLTEGTQVNPSRLRGLGGREFDMIFTSRCMRLKRMYRLKFAVFWKVLLATVFVFVTVAHYRRGVEFQQSTSAGEVETHLFTGNKSSVNADTIYAPVGDPGRAQVHKPTYNGDTLKAIPGNAKNVAPLKDSSGFKLAPGPANAITKPNTEAYVTVKAADHFDGEPSNSNMVILQYTEFYHSLKAGSFDKCKYSKCEWTTDRSRLNQSHAVLFHMWGGVLRKLGLPKHHPLWQKWIFFTKEAPTRYKFNTWSPMLGAVYHLDLPHLNGAFNLTMTFMSQSDMPFMYGRAVKRAKAVEVGTDFARGKTATIAWVVSHCNTSSGRELLVRELQKHVKVDIYGRCGPQRCPDNCFNFLGKKYKFYLALENSDCEDYITEKFWFNSFSYNMVPIVLGERTNYHKLAPPHSYIHWDKYSVEELAQLIKKIDSDDRLYNEYFRWRRDYYIDNMNAWMCDMCEYLHKNRRQVKYYTNIENFWDATQRCKLRRSKLVEQLGSS